MQEYNIQNSLIFKTHTGHTAILLFALRSPGNSVLNWWAWIRNGKRKIRLLDFSLILVVSRFASLHFVFCCIYCTHMCAVYIYSLDVGVCVWKLFYVCLRRLCIFLNFLKFVCCAVADSHGEISLNSKCLPKCAMEG